MSAWWGWPTRFRGAQEATGADLSDEQPIREPVDAEPLRAPRGQVVWLCQLPSGIEPSIHDTEQAAANRAALYDGAVIWPVTIELEETG